MKKALLGAALAAGMMSYAQAQTLTVMNPIEVAHLDPMRTSSPSYAAYLISDTLVSLDYDLKTIHPLLAKSWTISEDGKTYTFKLRDDVTFCSGKKMTSADVVYSVKRMVDKDTKSPFYWRMGKVKDVRASDPYTVEYELEEPFSELLPNLAMFQASILNEDNVKELGRDFGVKGIDGTGPYCFTSLGNRCNRDGGHPPSRIQVGSSVLCQQGTGKVREDHHQDRAGRSRAPRGDGERADGPDDVHGGSVPAADRQDADTVDTCIRSASCERSILVSRFRVKTSRM